jgi:hypothetical protein
MFSYFRHKREMPEAQLSAAQCNNQLTEALTSAVSANNGAIQDLKRELLSSLAALQREAVAQTGYASTADKRAEERRLGHVPV